MKLVQQKIASAMTTVSFTDSDNSSRDVIFRQYVSDAMEAGTIAVQTVKFQIRGAEGSTSGNMATSIGIRVVSNDGTTVRGTILSVTRDGSEMDTSLQNRSFSATTTEVTAQANDRLIIEIGTGGDPTIGGHDSDLRIGDAAAGDLPEDDTDVTDSNPWVEFESFPLVGLDRFASVSDSISITENVAQVNTKTQSVSDALTISESVSPRRIFADLAQGMNVAYGSYTGNGVDGRSIIGVGFTPDFVLITGVSDPHFRTAQHEGDTLSSYFAFGATDEANHIKSIDVDGFTVGNDTDVNVSPNTYYWMAIRNHTPGFFKTGSYVGDGADNHDITGVGFRPDVLYIKGSGSRAGVMSTSAMPADSTVIIDSTETPFANAIQSFAADGFQVGTHTRVNTNAITYRYVAMKSGSSVQVGTYTGDGTTPRDITGVGFDPTIVWVRAATSDDAIWKSASMSGTDSFSLANYEAQGAQGLRAFITDGFTVGSLNEVNSSGFANYYVAFKNIAAPEHPFDNISISESVTVVRVHPISTSDSISITEDVARTRSFAATQGIQMEFGTYDGNNVDGRVIPVSFKPDLVLVTGFSDPRFKTVDHVGDASSFFAFASADDDLGIKSLLSNGFTVAGGLPGTEDVNSISGTYHWMAVKSLENSYFKVGTYVGDGNDDRTITGVGFRPDYVYVKAATNKGGVFTTSLNTDFSMHIDSGTSSGANYIQAMAADGFQIGSHADVNALGVTYYYISFKQGASFAVGTYAGDAVDSRNITQTQTGSNLWFAPAAVWVKTDGNDDAVWKSSSMATTDAYSLANYGAQGGNTIQSLFANGFQIGTDAAVNDLSSSYYWAAFLNVTDIKTSDLTISENVAVVKIATQSLVDTVSITESVTVVAPNIITVNDAVSITESVTVVLILEVSVSDSVSITENTASDFITTASVFDAVSITENVVAAQGFNTGLVFDAVSITEDVAQTHGYNASASDDVSIADVFTSFNLTANIELAQTVTTEEDVAQTQVFTTSVSDAISITEDVSVLSSFPIEVFDAVSIAENVVNEKVTFASVFDAVSITESTTQEAVRLTSVFDAVSITEDVNQTQVFTKERSEDVLITESATQEVVHFVSVSDAISIVDSDSQVETDEQSVVDSISITESVSVVKTIEVSTSDSVSITESQTLLKVVEISVFDAISIVDSDSQVETDEQNVVDSVSITESVSQTQVFTASVFDAVSITENVTDGVTLTSGISTSDSISVLESVTTDITRLILVFDALSITESQAGTWTLATSEPADQISITENVSVALALAPSVSDSVSITESVSLSVDIFVSVSDAISIADDEEEFGFFQTEVFDAVSIAENTATLGQGSVSTFDSISITESAEPTYILATSVSDSLSITETTAFDRIRMSSTLPFTRPIGSLSPDSQYSYGGTLY